MNTLNLGISKPQSKINIDFYELNKLLSSVENKDSKLKLLVSYLVNNSKTKNSQLKFV